jgi:hypothetical protein
VDHPEYRLRKWNSVLVLCSTDPDSLMMAPDLPDFYVSDALRLQMIATRNLSRRALQKWCTADGETN